MTNENEAVRAEWTTAKPTRPGAYYIRGFNYGEPEQFEALVQVRMHTYKGESAEEMAVNLHESTSEDRLDKWAPLVDISDDFEWLGPLYPASEIDRLTGEVSILKGYLHREAALHDQAKIRAEMAEQLYQAAFFAQAFVAYAANNAKEPRLAKECEQAINEAINRYRSLTQPEVDHAAIAPAKKVD